MNSDQVEGTARKAAGKICEGAGNIIGDDQMQGKGVLDQSVGAIQHGYGQVKENAKTLVEGVPALNQLAGTARKVGRRINETLNDQFGRSAPTYVLAGAVAFLAIAVFWAGRDHE